jgi:hypothetical protein
VALARHFEGLQPPDFANMQRLRKNAEQSMNRRKRARQRRARWRHAQAEIGALPRDLRVSCTLRDYVQNGTRGESKRKRNASIPLRIFNKIQEELFAAT